MLWKYHFCLYHQTMMYQLFHQKRLRNINEIRRLLSEGTVVNGKFSPGEDYRKKYETERAGTTDSSHASQTAGYENDTNHLINGIASIK